MDAQGLALDDYGDPTAYGADGTTYTTADIAEAQKMSQFVPNDGSGDAWWTSIVKYGITRAIDNTLPAQQRAGIQGNTNPGTFAGQNGRTYGQPGPLNATPRPVMAGGGSMGMSPAVLLGLGVVALLLLPKLLK